MVTAYGRDEVRQEAERVGLDAFLIKPVSASSLCDAVMGAMGIGAVKRGRRERAATLAARHVRGAHLLLVEDNDINQQVAFEILQQAGIRVTLAENGQLALDTLNRSPGSFDGVLMDIQMPVMDGYQASREIRRDARLRHLPIIAMTANAMESDRDEALAAGMNDHLPKPIDVDQLMTVLGRWIRAESPERGERLPEVPRVDPGDAAQLPELPGIDTVDGLNRVGGNLALYRRLLNTFSASKGDIPQRVREALARGDRESARREAHSLRGVAGNIGAKRLAEAAASLEDALKREDGDPQPHYAPVEAALSEVLDGLQALSEPTGRPAPESVGDGRQVATLLQQLQEALEEDSPRAVEITEALQQALAGSDLASTLDEIARCLTEYDFDAALLLHRKLLAADARGVERE
ncbi:MAG: hypothetical protein B0D94_00845 [Candidatus Sedimenticola endophacoides]|nr:MAG: hypothetical protein B0D94_00845 [Candidatus Sedimenticola endophacoides]